MKEKESVRYVRNDGRGPSGGLLRRSAGKITRRLVAGGAGGSGHHQARDVDGLEVGKGETSEAGKVGVIPAGIGRADEAAARAIVGEDDAVIAESSDDDGRLRTRCGTRWCGDRSFEAINLTGRAGHGAACGRRRLRDERFRGNCATAGRTTTDASGFRGRPHPIIEHVIQREANGMLNSAVRRAWRAGADDFVSVDQQRGHGKTRSVGSAVALRRERIGRDVRPQSVRGIGPRAAFVDALPHFI